jgi:hypothetical protein
VQQIRSVIAGVVADIKHRFGNIDLAGMYQSLGLSTETVVLD